jgi:predicted double-glycine peptidase
MTGNGRVRFFGAAFLALIVSLYAVWPFAASATNRGYLAALPTRFDTNGICLQSTDYTCGPAAAVTALRHLGLRGHEGQIAIASHASAAIGTPPDMLSRGLRSLYAAQGLECDLRYFAKLEELPVGQPILAVIKYTILEDHYVVILGITPEHVLVADPNRGHMAYTHTAFLDRWRKLGIVLSLASDRSR